MTNEKVRKAVADTGVKNWRVAELLSISPQAFSTRMRHEMSDDEQNRIVDLIYEEAARRAQR